MKYLIFLLLCASAWAQGSFYRFPTPLPSARVSVCPVPSGGNPCPSPVAIFNDKALTQPLANPYSVAQTGDFGFWIAAGQYEIQVAQPYNLVYTISLGAGAPLAIGSPAQIPVMNAAGTAYAPQTKSMIDVRDLGVDCSGATSASTILSALTGSSPTTDNAINGVTVSFARCPNVSLASTWLIKNQAGFRITGLTRSGANGSGPKITWTGAANGVMIDMEYVDGFQVDGLSIQGGANAGVGVQVDKNGSGGILNTTDGKFINNTFGGSNVNWIGLLISPVSISNVEDMRAEDNTFSCNVGRVISNNQVGIKVGNSQNAKNEIFKHNNISTCFYGIWVLQGSFQARDNELSGNGGACATGTGADIRIDGSTDVDIIEGNLDENSTQGINNDNDVSGNSMLPVIVRGNHAAPAGCENTSLYWYNVATGGTIWTFEGNSFDTDNNLLKVIGSNQAGGVGQANIITSGNTWPNLLFTPWWKLATQNGFSPDFGLHQDALFAYGSKLNQIPSAGNNLSSPVLDFRSFINGATSNYDVLMQNLAGTFLVKGAQSQPFITLDGPLPSLTITPLSTPAAPAISVQGTAGSTTYTYSLVAYAPTGNTIGSPTVTTSTGNATLSGTNFNQLSWPQVGGATKFCIWRTVGGATQGDIGCTSAIQSPTAANPKFSFGFAANSNSVTGVYQFNDTGLAGDSAVLPSTNTTGAINSTGGTFSITGTGCGTLPTLSAGNAGVGFGPNCVVESNSNGSGWIAPGTGVVFNALSYGWIDDDVTDNCGTPVTNFTAAVNAYAGPGQPIVIIPMGPAQKAYKFATAGCNLTFTIPVTIHLWGNLDCAQPATTANCIQFGVTKTNGTTGYSNPQIFKYMIDGGGTITGGVNLTNAGIEIEPTTVNSLITQLNFKNFGASNATLGNCTNYAVLYDFAVAEGTVSNNHWQVTDTTNGRCAFGNPNGSTTGSNTVFFVGNTLGGQNATNTTGCSSQGIVDGGSLSMVQDNNIYAFGVPVRVQGVGQRLMGNQIDAAGCTASSVSAAIQFGATSSSTAVGPLQIIGNIAQVTTLAGHTSNLFAQAGDSTATIFGANIIGNASNGSAGGSYGALMPSTTPCTDLGGSGNPASMCYEYGNVGLTGVVPCGATAPGWQFENIFAGCFNQLQSANLAATTLVTPTIVKSTMVSCTIILVTAATTSSTLPTCSVKWTDLFTGVVMTAQVTPTWASGTVNCSGSATNTVGNSCQGVIGPIVPTNGTAIQYSTSGYASTGATAMQYTIGVRAVVQ